MNQLAQQALPWIVALPLAGAAINGANLVFGWGAPPQVARKIAIGAVAGAFLIALLCFFSLTGMPTEASLTNHVYDWFTLKFGDREIAVGVTFVMDHLSGIMTLFVTGIGTLIHIYSDEYMEEDASVSRFFTYLNLFMASMLILVLASSLPLLFVGWEGVGLCSYLLIGFWFENRDYAMAGKKAFIVNRIGDFGVIIGMFILMQATGSLEFDAINRAARNGALSGTFELPKGQMIATVIAVVALLLGIGFFALATKKVAISKASLLVPAVVLGGALYVLLGVSPTVSMATAACLFIFLGCTGKSAQLPLFVWLPDAMAGPTPVSALIHAATMVTAGVYLCCRLSFVFVQAPTALMVISVVGALTALIAASIALVQNHMKRILAYSTVSQLGFMFAAVGAGAFEAGLFHVFTHAFFKACLFLGAGAVMHAVHAHGDADIRLLGGMKKYLPVVNWTFLVSCLAIAGVPMFSGFFSKDEVLLGVLHSAHMAGYVPAVSYFVFGTLVLAATMTAFYMFRLYFLTFTGTYRSLPAGAAAHGHDDHAHDAHGADAHAADAHDDHGHGEGYSAHPHAPGKRIAFVLSVLGVGAVVAGYLNLEPLHIHSNLWGHWLEGSVAALPHEAGNAVLIAGAGGFFAMLIGIGGAFTIYNNGKTLPKEHPTGLHQLLMDKWKVDELYEAVVVWPMRVIARFSAAFDKYFIDAILARATALSIEVGGFLFTRLQTGLVYGYGAVMAAGLLVVGAWFFLPHPALRVEKVEGETVTFAAARGFGYAYRWDRNGDGRYDGEFESGEEASVIEHKFDSKERKGIVVRLSDDGGETGHDIVLQAHDEVQLDAGKLGAGWAKEGSAPRPPMVKRTGNSVVLTVNDAFLGGDQAKTHKLKLGESIQIGNKLLRVGALVRASLEVRNAFGSVAHADEDVVVFPPFRKKMEARDLGEIK